MSPTSLRILPDILPQEQFCPTAQSETAGTIIFGIVDGTAEPARTVYLTTRVRPTAALLALAAPADPGTLFRFAAPCAEGRCAHFGGGRCALGEQLVQLPAVHDSLPPCSLRPACRWWNELGAAACHRCSQVVTAHARPAAGTPRLPVTSSPGAAPPREAAPPLRLLSRPAIQLD